MNMQNTLDTQPKNMTRRAVIVGAGLSGATAAALLADRGYSVTVYEARPHIGGNCADGLICNTRVHMYGPHIFHTDDEEVYEFLSRYTSWFDFKLQPRGRTRLGEISLPYSKKTVSELGRELSQEEIVEYIFKDYSEKQWGVPFNLIPKSITNRIPKTKDASDPTWFEGQKYQCMPSDGYTAMFTRMLNHPLINVILNAGEDAWKESAGTADLVVYTGKIDEYYNYEYGRLPYRSLTFEHAVGVDRAPTFIVNQNNADVQYTRIYDHAYFNPQHRGSKTVITKEYPKECGPDDIPFYPIPWGDGLQLYSRYEKRAAAESGVIFAGRLATYTYLDMWMAVKQVMLKLKNHK